MFSAENYSLPYELSQWTIVKTAMKPKIDIPDKEDMTTMVAILNKLHKDGYTMQLKAEENGIYSMDSGKKFKPRDVEIKHFYRFEGESDPSDNAIVYAIETKTGEKGTLIDSYGAYSDANIEKFIKEVKAIQKD
jgi:hypothetical protein